MTTSADVDTSTLKTPAATWSPATQWSIVGLLVVLYSVSMLDRNLLALMAPYIATDLGLSEVQMGTIIGMGFALFYGLATLPIGWAMDRYPRPLVMWAGVTVWSLATMACGFAGSFWSLFGARSLVGAGEAVVGPGSHSIIPELFPPQKLALPMSVLGTSSKIGGGVALGVGGALAMFVDPVAHYSLAGLHTFKGWQLIFVLAGAPGLLLGLALFAVPNTRRAASGRKAGASYGDYARFALPNWRFVVPHHLALMPLAIAVSGIMAWAPSFFLRIHHLSVKEVGFALGLAVAVGPVIALPLHGWIVDRLYQRGIVGIHLLYTCACVLASAPLLIGAFAVSSPTLAFWMIGVFFAVACPYLSLPATVLQLIVPGEFRAKASSVVLALNLILTIGGGPLLAAMLTEALGGPQMVGYSLMICALIGLPMSAALLALAIGPARKLLMTRLSQAKSL